LLNNNILKTLDEAFSYILFDEMYHKYYTAEGYKFKKSVTGTWKKFIKPFDAYGQSIRSAEKLGVSPESLRSLWKNKGSNSSTRGNYFHDYAECHYTGRDRKYEIINRYQKKEFHRFLEETKGRYEFIAAEYDVGSKKINTAGKIDGIFWDNKLVGVILRDWKTNQEIKMSSQYKLIHDLRFLDNCEFIIYSLQSSLYKYIIELETNIKIVNMEIAHFGKYAPYNIINCKDFTPLIKKMLSNKRL